MGERVETSLSENEVIMVISLVGKRLLTGMIIHAEGQEITEAREVGAISAHPKKELDVIIAGKQAKQLQYACHSCSCTL